MSAPRCPRCGGQLTEAVRIATAALACLASPERLPGESRNQTSYNDVVRMSFALEMLRQIEALGLDVTT